MPLYFLSFRDIAAPGSLGVTAGEVYALTPMTAKVDWRKAELTGAQWVPWAQVSEVFRDKRVCFVIHGFNVPLSDGVRGGGPMAQEFEGLGIRALKIAAADVVVPVLWPGDGIQGWSWLNAFHTSKTAGARFSDFLISSAFQAAEVSFISHSLGARVVLETVKQTLARRPGFAFDTAVLTAAAIDDNALDDPEYAPATNGLRRIVVLSSMKDTVLQTWFTIGSAIEGALWWGYHPTTRALGRFGPAFKPGSPGPAKTEWYEVRPGIGQDHGDYLPDGNAGLPTNGWSDKREKVGLFCQDVFDKQPFKPALDGWGFDHTPDFRSPWPPRF